ncbi:MAG: hypothetical protein JHD02_09815 [Thermoleophilaceae bacterium]|nr:hypothetical protein [Thermoleophilaceae bacterium]
MKKALSILGVLVVVLVLAGSFVVYPAVAASAARDRVTAGINDVAAASGVKLSGVTVDVEGSNGISALAGGKKVGDISVRIARIELPEGATAGVTPAVEAEDEAKVAGGARDIFDAIEDVGSFKLAVGDVTSGQDKLALNYSSIKLSDGAWELALSVPQDSVQTLLTPIGVKLEVTASGPKVTGRVAFADQPAENFTLTVVPADQGRAIAYNLNGQQGTEVLSEDDDYRLSSLKFSTADSLYSITVAGTYDFDAVRASIEKELR